MSHNEAEELLARRSELTAEENARLEEHLAGCPQCRETAEVYARQSALLRSLPLAAPPPALRAGVLGGIQQRPRRRWAFRPGFVLTPLGVVTAAVLAAVLFQHVPSGSGHNTALTTGRKGASTSRPVMTAQAPLPKKHKTHTTRRHRSHHRAGHSGSPPSTTTGSGYSVAVGPITNSPYTPYQPPAASGAQGAAPTAVPATRKPVLTAKSHPTQPAGAASPVGSVPPQPVTGGSGAPPPRPPATSPRPSATPQPGPPTITIFAPTVPTPTPPPATAPPPPVVVTAPSSPAPLPSPTP